MVDGIATDPEIRHGSPVIGGTSVPFSRIVGRLAGGMTKDEIIREYDVTEEDIKAGAELCERADRSC